jgi:hypothetical protein
MDTLSFFTANVKFDVNDKPIKFSVIHNLPQTQGLNFDAALENWLYRTDKYTAKSLCDYIMSKETGYVCMTLSQWKRLNS